MDGERAVDAGDVVELRLSELGSPVRLPSYTEVLHIQAGVVGLHDSSLVDSQLVDAPYVLPVHRLLQPPTIVDQHDDDGAAVESSPLDGGCRFLLPFEVIKGALYEGVEVVILQVQVKTVFQGFFSRGVDNLGEQSVALVQAGELHIRDDRFTVEAVRLRVVLRGPILVHQVDIAVLPVWAHSLPCLPLEDLTTPFVQLSPFELILRYTHGTSLLPVRTRCERRGYSKRRRR